MPTRNINLTDHLDRLIESYIASGRYKNASEVVREGLRLLEQRQQENAAKLKMLREKTQIGFDAIARGDYIEVDQKGLRDLLTRLGQKAGERTKTGRSRH